MSSFAKLSQERRKSGLCAKCGKPSPVEYLCTDCQERRRLSGIERRQRYRTQHRCVHCGKPAIASECPDCARIHRKIKKKVRRKKDRLGLCDRCSKLHTKRSRLCKDHLRFERELLKTRLKNGLCTQCGKPTSGGRYCEACLQPKRDYKARIKNEVLQHYGGKCACCNLETPEFLTMDHINGGGNQHRKKIKESIYRWLYHNNFPSGFRVLCANCNMSYGLFGYCPHKKS